MKSLGRLAIIWSAVLGFFLTPVGLFAQCWAPGQMHKIRVGSIIREVCQGTSGDCGLATNAARAALYPNLRNYWDRVLERGPLEPGPRAARPRTSVNQRLLTPSLEGRQTWIYTRAVDGPLTVSLTKRRGRASAHVRFCAIGMDGDERDLGPMMDFDGGRNNFGEQQSRTFQLNRESVLVVVVATGDLPTNAFDYDLLIGR